MTQGPMTLAARVRKISGLGVMADASRQLGDLAQTYAVSSLHRRTQRDATAQLLALIASPEGQEALKRLEELAVIFADLGVAMAEADPPYVWVGDRI